ncbi:hypothetical protein BaRGS_00012450, partial [Batillaria attramentaria]
ATDICRRSPRERERSNGFSLRLNDIGCKCLRTLRVVNLIYEHPDTVVEAAAESSMDSDQFFYNRNPQERNRWTTQPVLTEYLSQANTILRSSLRQCNFDWEFPSV